MNVQYKLIMECQACGRQVEKFTAHRHSGVTQAECAGCGELDVVFTTVEDTQVQPEDVPGVGVR